MDSSCSWNTGEGLSQLVDQSRSPCSPNRRQQSYSSSGSWNTDQGLSGLLDASGCPAPCPRPSPPRPCPSACPRTPPPSACPRSGMRSPPCDTTNICGNLQIQRPQCTPRPISDQPLELFNPTIHSTPPSRPPCGASSPNFEDFLMEMEESERDILACDLRCFQAARRRLIRDLTKIDEEEGY